MTTRHSSRIQIAVVDDHLLFRKGLVNLIHQLSNEYQVCMEANHGKDLLQKLETTGLPQILILDVNMPVMDGFETTRILRETYPGLRILALTMLEDDVTLVKLLKAGVDGYLNKDIEPSELKEALDSLAANGNYYTEKMAGKLVNVIRKPLSKTNPAGELSEQELRFLELACSDDTYQAIADKMCLSTKTIDGYRAKLFEKLGAKSRVGLVLFALKNELVSLDQL